MCCPTRIRRSGKSDRTNAVQAARKIPPHALPDRAGGYPERRDRTQNVVPVPRDGGYRDQARYRWAHNVAYQARDKSTPPADRRHRSAPGQGQAMTAAVDGDRKSVVEGKRVSVRVAPGGRRTIKQKKQMHRVLS